MCLENKVPRVRAEIKVTRELLDLSVHKEKRVTEVIKDFRVT